MDKLAIGQSVLISNLPGHEKVIGDHCNQQCEKVINLLKQYKTDDYNLLLKLESLTRNKLLKPELFRALMDLERQYFALSR